MVLFANLFNFCLDNLWGISSIEPSWFNDVHISFPHFVLKSIGKILAITVPSSDCTDLKRCRKDVGKLCNKLKKKESLVFSFFFYLPQKLGLYFILDQRHFDNFGPFILEFNGWKWKEHSQYLFPIIHFNDISQGFRLINVTWDCPEKSWVV